MCKKQFLFYNAAHERFINYNLTKSISPGAAVSTSISELAVSFQLLKSPPGRRKEREQGSQGSQGSPNVHGEMAAISDGSQTSPWLQFWELLGNILGNVRGCGSCFSTGIPQGGLEGKPGAIPTAGMRAGTAERSLPSHLLRSHRRNQISIHRL